MKILGSLLFGLFCVTNLSHAETFPYSDMVPKDCLVWNDGCNDCTKKSDNSWDCPERNCFNEMAGYCKMSSDEAVKPVVVEKIMPPVPNAPAGCTKWFDGCNTCLYKEGNFSSCTRMACETYEEPKCLSDESIKPFNDSERAVDESGEATIPSGCALWFDGCNNCVVEEGELTSCTEMACAKNTAPARCLKGESHFNPGPKKVELDLQPSFELSLWGMFKYHLLSLFR